MNKNYNIPASYLVLINEDKILLLKRFNTGYEDGNYSMIAGHVDEGETFTDCIIREAQEEAGIIVKPEYLSVAHIMHRNQGNNKNNQRVDVFFVVKKWEGKLENKEPHKCDDLSWFDIDELPEKTIPFIKIALKNIREGVHYSEFGW